MIEEPRMFKTMLMGNFCCLHQDPTREESLAVLVKCRAFEVGPVIQEAVINDIPIPEDGLWPPFEYGWFEWCQEDGAAGQVCRYGLLVESDHRADGWLVTGGIFIQATLSDQPAGPISAFHFTIDNEGRLVRGSSQSHRLLGIDGYDGHAMGQSGACATRLIFSRLNSKCTITEERRWKPNVVKRMRPTCRPPCKGFVYHVIKVACTAPGPESSKVRQYRSMHQMLHSVRGHGKTYVTKGLFGRHLGTFYWPYHYRGDPGLGVIGKHYLVGVQ